MTDRKTDSSRLNSENAGALCIISDLVDARPLEEAAMMKKIKHQIDEDLAYFEQQMRQKETELLHHFKARIVEALRGEYVKRMSTAQTLFPIKRLMVFNTWYPPKGL